MFLRQETLNSNNKMPETIKHLTPQYSTYSKMSVPFAFFGGTMVLLKENYPGNVLKAWRYTPTKHEKSSLHIIALTRGSAM